MQSKSPPGSSRPEFEVVGPIVIWFRIVDLAAPLGDLREPSAAASEYTRLHIAIVPLLVPLAVMQGERPLREDQFAEPTNCIGNRLILAHFDSDAHAYASSRLTRCRWKSGTARLKPNLNLSCPASATAARRLLVEFQFTEPKPYENLEKHGKSLETVENGVSEFSRRKPICCKPLSRHFRPCFTRRWSGVRVPHRPFVRRFPTRDCSELTRLPWSSEFCGAALTPRCHFAPQVPAARGIISLLSSRLQSVVKSKKRGGRKGTKSD
jgi:hypothetical protein